MSIPRARPIALSLGLILLSCGGSDDPAGPSVPTTPDPPALTVLTVSLSAGDVAEGGTVNASASGRDQFGAAMDPGTVVWSTSDTSRARVDAAGTVAAVARGQVRVRAASAGVQGEASLMVTPRPNPAVEAGSSYGVARDNARAGLLDWRTFPEDGPMKTARAVADFDGDGVPDVFLAAGIFLEQSPTVPVRFFRGAAEGGPFTDMTSSWIVGPAPGLLSARKVILGDFNADGILDPFTCAHGYDADPFPGTTNLLLLSADGQWSPAEQSWTGSVGFHHGCASGDIDNDGDLDMIVLESNVASYLLLNDGTGVFTLDRAGLPASIRGKALVFTAEFVDVDDDGFLDLMVGGDEVYQPTMVFWGDGTGAYDDGRSTALPPMPGWTNVTILAAEDVDGDGLDEAVVGRAKGAYGDPDFYMGFRVQVASRSGRSFTDITAASASATNESAVSVLLDYKDDPKWIEWMWVADYDGDGRPDLLGSDGYTGSYLARNQGGVFGPWTRP